MNTTTNIIPGIIGLDFQFSFPGKTKQDKRVREGVASAENADESSVSVAKKLWHGPRFTAVAGFARSMEAWLSTTGVRYKTTILVKTDRAIDVVQEANAKISTFEHLCDEFAANYADEMTMNRTKLGAMFDWNLYPNSAAEARAQFKAKLLPCPITHSDSVARLIVGEVGNRLAAEMQEAHEAELARASERVLEESGAILERLLHVCEKDGQTRITNSLFDDIESFIRNAEARLINPDQRVTNIVAHLRSAIGTYTRTDLAKNKSARSTVARRLRNVGAVSTVVAPEPEPEPVAVAPAPTPEPVWTPSDAAAPWPSEPEPQIEEQPPEQPQPQPEQEEPEPEPVVIAPTPIVKPPPSRRMVSSAFARLPGLR